MLYRIVFRNADVILLSKNLYPDIFKYVSESRVHYCPNGIPENKSIERKEGGEPVELLFLSHLIKSKGVIVLIEANGILRDKGVHFLCTIAGGDAELTRKEVQDIITYKELSSSITVAGPVYGEDRMNVMLKADILVHPTFNDCLPLIILEAMQNSIPVVSTFEGAIPEVVEDGITGFLVPQKDSKALAKKLELLIKDPELRQKMGRSGREKYEKEFTLAVFEKRMKEILEKI